MKVTNTAGNPTIGGVRQQSSLTKMLYISMVRYRSWMSLYLSSMTKDFVLISAIVVRTNLRSSRVAGLFLRFLPRDYESIQLERENE